MTYKRLAAACFVLSLTFFAHAENIEHQDKKENYRFFTDTKSGNDWREFKGTDGLSYETILKKLESDHKFKGWRIASEQEVKALISNTLEVPVAELEGLALSGDERIIQLIRLLDGGDCNQTICVAGLVSDPAPECSHSGAEEGEQCRTFMKIEARSVADQAAWEKHYSDESVAGCDRKIIKNPGDPRPPCAITYGDVLPDMSIDRVVWLRNGVYLIRPSH
ncbi:MAG: hypothetical protein Q8K59_04015 [Nitrosomonas sp.]|nr:hypothetical protein [Nitrosomonas sp.]MDP1950254.1 hypothetical protein [Nitrosomonas sp.]